MFKEFKEFAMRGNVVDMAVGIIIGAAFGSIVKSLVADVIMPPIAPSRSLSTVSGPGSRSPFASHGSLRASTASNRARCGLVSSKDLASADSHLAKATRASLSAFFWASCAEARSASAFARAR